MKKLLLLAPLLLSSCAFTHISGYRPFGPGDTLTSGCSGERNTMGYEIADGLGFVVTALPYDKEKMGTIYLSYRIGEGHNFQLSSPNLSVVTTSDGLTHNFPISKFQYEEVIGDTKPATIKTHKFDPTASLIGAMLPWDQRPFFDIFGSAHSFREYRAKVEIGGLSAKRFRIVFPSASLDGSPAHTPDIEFEYREETVVTCLMGETPNHVLQGTLLASHP